MTEFTSNDSLTIETGSDGAVVLRGDIDMAGGPVLEAALLDRPEPSITIDLAGVSFIDSSGLRSLLEASRRARSLDGEVVLRSVGPEVARLLEITGTEQQFRVESRRD
jgi:anti-sigma B factor antagonist